jgi:hypothetical protein
MFIISHIINSLNTDSGGDRPFAPPLNMTMPLSPDTAFAMRCRMRGRRSSTADRRCIRKRDLHAIVPRRDVRRTRKTTFVNAGAKESGVKSIWGKTKALRWS